MTHPARTIPITDLVTGLKAANDNGHVRVTRNGPLSLWTYTDACVYDRAWTPITELARGLIVANEHEIVATPFPKFFNLGERNGGVLLGDVPNTPFEAFEKLDGSLIIIFWYGGEWHTATRGSFNSEQAQRAALWLSGRNWDWLVPGETWLAEYVGPDNRIVVSYPESKLILLGGYDVSGNEFGYEYVSLVAKQLGTRAAAHYSYGSLDDMVQHAATMPKDKEGFVVRFANGHRLKIKGDEYCRVHRLLSNITPLAIWDMLRNGDDLENVRRQLPEEFLTDFDTIRDVLLTARDKIVVAASDMTVACSMITDKEVGLYFKHTPFAHQPLVWLMRRDKHVNSAKGNAYLYKAIRPTANVLDGYVPSSALARLGDG